ncbi:MAG: LON peptidase substrate-binding domain-containing protein [Spirosomaceae bacterium]|nr:LON peptidase substrate-binding domain-containing protein [Spirosomataceae bacterium]
MKLPFFPLNLVAYPHEDLNLHIFEPRYRQLINECLETGQTFGIPPFINNRLLGYGTEMKVVELSKRYENGRMDIKTRGLRIFRITTGVWTSKHVVYEYSELLIFRTRWMTNCMPVEM